MVLITVFISLIAVLLIGAILIQNPKGGGIDITYGGKNSSQILGAAKTVNVMEKITWGLAASLIMLCIIAALTVTV